jgi:hypothetical protein
MSPFIFDSAVLFENDNDIEPLVVSVVSQAENANSNKKEAAIDKIVNLLVFIRFL